ncbi:glycosyltransferase family 4 protein [Pedobacter glucosidilyticus]|uniref:glycosyltransferase family 4 protein n=1 Tax=Pedobacter glucosidilyticus TaxID=1122941 RepID=UPI0026ECCB52|nr:glycosyltransferase family 4 protein [Pedobacter glucosidilyticus]
MLKKRYDIITCHPSKHHFYEQAHALSQKFNIRFLTSVYVPRLLLNVIKPFSKKLYQFLSKKSHPRLDTKYVVTHPATEIDIFWKKLRGKNYNYYDGNKKFQHWVTKNFYPPKIFIGVDTASGHIFNQWKGKSFLILDLVIALPQYRNKVYQQALQDNTALKPEDFHFSTEPELSIYKQEIELADLILCGSEFVKSSCLDYGIPEERLKVIEYGVDLDIFKPSFFLQKDINKFKMAFVGNFSIRKGSLLMEELMKRLVTYPNIELHVFGKADQEQQKRFASNTIFHGFIPQQILKERLELCNIMVFPTYFEGSAYAVYQSMSLGLPVITTPNCGSIIDEHSGIIIPVNDADALENAVIKLYNEPFTVKTMGQAAHEKAQHYSWDAYGEKIRSLVSGILEKQN